MSHAITLAVVSIIVAAVLVVTAIVALVAIVGGLLDSLRALTRPKQPRPAQEPEAVAPPVSWSLTKTDLPTEPLPSGTAPLMPRVTQDQVCETFGIGDREVRGLVKAGLLKRASADHNDLTVTGDSYSRLVNVRQSNGATG